MLVEEMVMMLRFENTCLTIDATRIYPERMPFRALELRIKPFRSALAREKGWRGRSEAVTGP